MGGFWDPIRQRRSTEATFRPTTTSWRHGRYETVPPAGTQLALTRGIPQARERRQSMSQDPRTDDELLEAVAARDSGVLAVVLARHGQALATAIRRSWQGVQAQDVEEIAADVLADLWFEYACIDPARGTMAAWLSMRARFRALDARRANSRRASLLSRLHSLTQQAASRAEYASDLDAYLAGLDGVQRRLVYLRFVEGQPVIDVARAMGLSPKATFSRLERLKRRLATTVGSMEAEEDRSVPTAP